MPGYGYAAASKTKVKAWTALIHAFLAGRANLARVYLLIDARHGLKPVDDTVLKTLDKAAVNYQVVLTKADQVAASDLDGADRGDRRGAREASRGLSGGAGDVVAQRRRHAGAARRHRAAVRRARRVASGTSSGSRDRAGSPAPSTASAR